MDIEQKLAELKNRNRLAFFGEAIAVLQFSQFLFDIHAGRL